MVSCARPGRADGRAVARAPDSPRPLRRPSTNTFPSPTLCLSPLPMCRLSLRTTLSCTRVPPRASASPGPVSNCKYGLDARAAAQDPTRFVAASPASPRAAVATRKSSREHKRGPVQPLLTDPSTSKCVRSAQGRAVEPEDRTGGNEIYDVGTRMRARCPRSLRLTSLPTKRVAGSPSLISASSASDRHLHALVPRVLTPDRARVCPGLACCSAVHTVLRPAMCSRATECFRNPSLWRCCTLHGTARCWDLKHSSSSYVNL